MPVRAVSLVQVQDPWRYSKWNQRDYRGKDLWSRWVWSLEYKTRGRV